MRMTYAPSASMSDRRASRCSALLMTMTKSPQRQKYEIRSVRSVAVLFALSLVLIVDRLIVFPIRPIKYVLKERVYITRKEESQSWSSKLNIFLGPSFSWRLPSTTWTPAIMSIPGREDIIHTSLESPQTTTSESNHKDPLAAADDDDDEIPFVFHTSASVMWNNVNL